jgi:hypothetical protein
MLALEISSAAAMNDVGKVREIAEGAGDDHRLFGGESMQEGIERTAGVAIGVTFEGHAQGADGFDPIEDGRA